MTLLHPLALLWALLVLPILVAHGRRRRYPTQTVATLMFWDRALQAAQKRRWREGWRTPNPLWVTLSLLALLVLAMTDPRGTIPGPYDRPHPAIAALALRPQVRYPHILEGFVRLTCPTEDPHDVEVQLRHNGQLLQVIPFTLDATDHNQQIFELPHPGPGHLDAALVNNDNVPLCPAARLELPAISTRDVLLVSQEDTPLEQALIAVPGTRVQRIDPDDYAAWSEQAGTDRPKDVLVFHGYVPSALPEKPTLFVAPQHDSDRWRIVGQMDEPILMPADDDAPPLNSVWLKDIALGPTPIIAASGQVAVLARAIRGPLLLRWDAGGQPVILLAPDPAKGELAHRAAFPILIQNILNELLLPMARPRHEGMAADADGAHRNDNSALPPVIAITPSAGLSGPLPRRILLITAVLLGLVTWVLEPGQPGQQAQRLVTDGTRLALVGLAALAAADVRGPALPGLATGRSETLKITRIDAPPRIRADAPFELSIALHNPRPQAVELTIQRNGRAVLQETVDIEPGINHLARTLRASAQTWQRYTVQIDPGSSDRASASIMLPGEARPRVLLVSHVPPTRDGRDGTSYLADALRTQAIEVEPRPLSQVPYSLDGWRHYDLVIIDDVPAEAWTDETMSQLRTYVHAEGGGLIMLGGPRSFGPGGYHNTILADLLPVRCRFTANADRPHMAIVYVIDASGSMAGIKRALAYEACRAGLATLTPNDQAGILAFAATFTWVSPIEPVRNSGANSSSLTVLAAGGGTDLAPALREAGRALRVADAGRRHIVVLTDGHTRPSDFYGLTRGLSAAGITISTVAIGDQADRSLLEHLADWGQGRAYIAGDLSRIPQLFARETLAAARTGIDQRPTRIGVRSPDPMFEGIALGAAPPLLGHVLTGERPSARTLLVTEAGRPLLATWRYGLGQCLAFTSDARNRWAVQWLAWPGFGPFWAQVVRETMRPFPPSPLEIKAEVIAHSVRVAVEARHSQAPHAGRYFNHLSLIAEIHQPGCEPQRFPLTQHAPGLYRGQYRTTLGEPFGVRVRSVEGKRTIEPASVGVQSPAMPRNRQNAPPSRSLWGLLSAVAACLLVVEAVLRQRPGPRTDAVRATP